MIDTQDVLLWPNMADRSKVLIDDSFNKKKSIFIIGSDATLVGQLVFELMHKYFLGDQFSLYDGNDAKELRLQLMYQPPSIGVPVLNEHLSPVVFDYMKHGGFGVFGVVADSVYKGLLQYVLSLLPVAHKSLDRATLAYDLCNHIDTIIDIQESDVISAFVYNNSKLLHDFLG